MAKSMTINGKQIRDLTGKRIGQFTAIRFDHKRKTGSAFWLFRCDCGNEKILKRHEAKEQINCGCVEVGKLQMSLKERLVKEKMRGRARQKENYKLKRQRERQEEGVSGQNAFGFTDLTPYNAMNGKEVMSKPTLTDMRQEVPGGYNTGKR